MPRVSPQEAEEDAQQRGLPGPRGPHDRRELTGGQLERHVVEHLTAIERLRHVLEPDRQVSFARRSFGGWGARRRRTTAVLAVHACPGKKKKIIFTRITSLRMIRIDPRTTLRVEASPTPSVPRLVVNISARHCHVTQEDLERLFGPGHQLHVHKPLYQDGFLQQYDVDLNKVIFSSYALKNLNIANSSFNFFIDSDGDVWLWALNNGVFLFQPQHNSIRQFNENSFPSGLNTNLVSQVAEDNKGMIWVATDHGGINLIDKKNNFNIT